jgi:hypothetical protein
MSADTVTTPEQRRLYEHFSFPLRFEALLGQVSSSGILTNRQIAIIRARCAGASYVKIQKKFSLCNEEAVSRSLVRTALGFTWTGRDVGGRRSYVSDADILEFKKIVSERSRQINCITRSEGLALAFQLRQTGIQTRIELLTVIQPSRLIEIFDERLLALYPLQEPDDRLSGRSAIKHIWLNLFADLKHSNSPDECFAIANEWKTFW